MDKVEQALYWPESMLEDIRTQAVRLDRSLSWCAQRAWVLGGPRLRALEPLADDPDAEAIYDAHFAKSADHRKQTLFFPIDMVNAIQAEAARLDRSKSWLVQRAWCLARADVEKLPATGAPTDEE